MIKYILIPFILALIYFASWIAIFWQDEEIRSNNEVFE